MPHVLAVCDTVAEWRGSAVPWFHTDHYQQCGTESLCTVRQLELLLNKIILHFLYLTEKRERRY